MKKYISVLLFLAIISNTILSSYAEELFETEDTGVYETENISEENILDFTENEPESSIEINELEANKYDINENEELIIDEQDVSEDIVIENDGILPEYESEEEIVVEDYIAEDAIELSAGVKNPSEITIYSVLSDYAGTIVIPDTYMTDYNLTGTTFIIMNGNTVNVDNNGHVTPIENIYGDTQIYVSYEDGTSSTVLVHVKNYSEEYAYGILNNYVDSLASDTDEEKARKFTSFIAQNYNYADNVSSYTRMVLEGGGNCVASTNAIIYMCERAGITAVLRNASNDSGASANHVNVLITIGNKNYIADAGYDGRAPRTYHFYEVTTLYRYTTLNDGTVKLTSYLGTENTVNIPQTVDNKVVSTLAGNMFTEITSVATCVNVPEGITTIEDGAFNSMRYLEEVNLPASLSDVSADTFSGSLNINNVNISANNNNYTSVNGVVYSKNNETLVYYPPKHGNSFNVPNTTKIIGTRAFYTCSGAMSITLPDGLTTIGESAFSNCGLNTFTIPATVTTIGTNAFYADTLICYSKTAPVTVNMVGAYVYAYKNTPAETAAINSGSRFIEISESGTIALDADNFYNLYGTFYYHANGVTPNITTRDNVYVNGTDYTVSYKNNKQIGTATATITGQGKYHGTVELQFTIVPNDLSIWADNINPQSLFSFKNNVSSYQYTGSEICPEIVFSEGSFANDFTVRYENNINKGRGRAIITGKENYINSITKEFIITAANLPDNIILSGYEFKYTGSEIKPTVTINGLEINKDFTVSYDNNIAPGTASVIVKGQSGSNYNTEDRHVINFTITPNSSNNSNNTANNQQNNSNTTPPPAPNQAKKDARKAQKEQKANNQANNVNSSIPTVKITKLKKSKKTLTVKWKKVAKASGYQIQVALDRDFNNIISTINVGKKKTNAKIKKLNKKKTYYVRIRAKKNSSYGNWSNIKSKKI